MGQSCLRARGAADDIVTIDRTEYIAAALGRALTWVEDHPPADGPTLGDTPRARKMVCKNGHVDPERYANGQCKACDRERRQRP